MESGNPSKLRKGAWDSEEDTLLRKCIQKYGEGKWHLVPQRAGLNRCRKSCRLRWLNYLRPTIKRGEFGEDEVDLMMRLHKLLGNRWSLIAGRLPGRTANDVKNFWNTNFQKKLTTVSYQISDMVKRKELSQRKQDSKNHTSTSAVIKPIPRTLSKGTRLPCYDLNPSYHMNSPLPEAILYNISKNNDNRIINKQPLIPATRPSDHHDGIEWWKNLLAEIEIHGQEKDSSEGLLMVSSNNLQNLDVERDLIWETSDQSSTPTTKVTGLLEDGQDGWNDIWDLLNS